MGARILVSGLINIETTLQVEGFPVHYSPVLYPFYGINSTVSGVGYNIARALQTLGDRPALLSLTGRDLSGELIARTMARVGLNGGYVDPSLEHTAQSVILYDRAGTRQIHTDLKDIQEQSYPADLFAEALKGCSLAVLSNINFSRPFLRTARQAGKLVATDVHAISDLDDTYNRDFMAAADILFMSHERLPCSPEEWARRLMEHYHPEIVVIGLGSEGALLAVRSHHFTGRFPAAYTRPVVSTIGAGDALFSAFLHFYHDKRDPYEALKKAFVFASYKIGEPGAAQGFLNEAGLEAYYRSAGGQS